LTMATIAAVSAVSSMSAAPYAVVSDPTAISLAAGKRRRETVMRAEQASKMVKMEQTVGALIPVPGVAAAQPIVTVRKSQGAKRPQMKYDPAVPMSKEETSAWRREQRRKRNRESAAACRKRQRDRISELDVEVNEWKTKFEDALMKLKGVDGESAKELEEQLETMFALAPTRCSTPPTVPDAVRSVTIPVGVTGSHVVSPYERPKFILPLVTSSSVEDTVNFPVLQDTIKANNMSGFLPVSDLISPRVENRQKKQQHLNERITRPAVKITGAATNSAVNTPLVNIESVCDDLLQVVPDSCLSSTEKKTMPFPEACPSLVPSAPDVTAAPGSSVADAVTMAAAAADVMNNMVPVDSGATVTTDESDEDSDLGEFLLDAVQWL